MSLEEIMNRMIKTLPAYP